jgi:hypothetical protein
MNDEALKRVMQKYGCTTIEELEKKRQELHHSIDVVGEMVFAQLKEMTLNLLVMVTRTSAKLRRN